MKKYKNNKRNTKKLNNYQNTIIKVNTINQIKKNSKK